MKSNSYIVKKTASTAIKGRWPICIAAAFIPVLFFILIGSFAVFFINLYSSAIATAIIVAFFIAFLFGAGIELVLGSLYFFNEIIENGNCQLAEVFRYFSCKKYYKSALNFSILWLGQIAVLGGIIFLPAAVLDYLASGSFSESFNITTPLWFSDLWGVSVVIKVIAFVIAAIFLIRIYTIPFAFIKSDCVPFNVCLKLAKQTSAFGLGNFITLVFSQILIIAISFLGAPLIFTLPFLTMCYTVHCRFTYFNTINKQNFNSAFSEKL